MTEFREEIIKALTDPTRAQVDSIEELLNEKLDQQRVLMNRLWSSSVVIIGIVLFLIFIKP